MSDTLPQIATYVSYDHNQNAVRTPVLAVSAHVSGRGGAWTFHVAFLMDRELFSSDLLGMGGGVPSGRYYRQASTRTYRTRRLARNAIRNVLEDHFGRVPAETRLRVGRSNEKTLSATWEV